MFSHINDIINNHVFKTSLCTILKKLACKISFSDDHKQKCDALQQNREQVTHTFFEKWVIVMA